MSPNCITSVWSFLSFVREDLTFTLGLYFRASLALLHRYARSRVSSKSHKSSTRSLHSAWLELELSSGICLTFSHLRVLFHESHRVIPYAAFSLRLKGTQHFFLCIPPSSLVLCLKNYRHLSLPKLWSFCPHFIKTLLSAQIPPSCDLESASKKKARNIVHITLFVSLLPGITALRCVLYDENNYFTHFCPNFLFTVTGEIQFQLIFMSGSASFFIMISFCTAKIALA